MRRISCEAKKILYFGSEVYEWCHTYKSHPASLCVLIFSHTYGFLIPQYLFFEMNYSLFVIIISQNSSKSMEPDPSSSSSSRIPSTSSSFLPMEDPQQGKLHKAGKTLRIQSHRIHLHQLHGEGQQAPPQLV